MLATIESFQKDLNSLSSDFEEYSQRKYPVFVLQLKKTNQSISFLFYRIDQTVKTIYFNRINSAQATTIDWTREPHNTIGAVVNTLAEDLQW